MRAPGGARDPFIPTASAEHAVLDSVSLPAPLAKTWRPPFAPAAPSSAATHQVQTRLLDLERDPAPSAQDIALGYSNFCRSNSAGGT